MGRQAERLLLNGVAIPGHVQRRTAGGGYRVQIPEEWGGFIKISDDAGERKISNWKVTVLIDPANPKNAMIYETVPKAIHYDPAANTFDTNSRLPLISLRHSRLTICS